MLAAVFTIPTILYFLAPLHEALGPTTYLPLDRKLLHLMVPFADYDMRVTFIVSGAVLGAVYFLARARLLQTASGTALAIAVLLPVYAVLPDIARNAAFIDARVPILLGLLLFAGIVPRPSRRGAIAVAAVFGTLLLLRTASIADTWTRHSVDLADLRAVIAPVEPGAKVLVVTVGRADGTAFTTQKDRALPGYMLLYTHMAALLVLERHAFWPLLFADKAQQPLTVLPPYDRLVGLPALPDFRELTEVPSVEGLRIAPYLQDWQHSFDYVLLLDADAAGNSGALVSDKLELLHATGIAALFRLRSVSTP